MEEQKGKNKDSSKGESDKISLVTKLTKVVTTIQKGIEKIKTKDPLKIFDGVLDIVSSLLNLVDAGKPYSFIFRILSEAVGMFFTESRQNQPSVVHQLTDVVHGEMIHFNKRLQDQKYDGLKLRVSEQIFQLQRMKEGEKLDDPSLWNDYMQFLGELASRFESPLPFKYESYLIDDPDVKDYVTAVVKYSEAHSCFMALLLVAKAKYLELGTAREDDVATVDRKMIFQIEEAKEKLFFLSEKRFLTFLGRIEGGKLTKIVALSRRFRDRSLLETVRQSLGLSPMPDLSTVESSAKKVSKQAVTLRSGKKCNGFLYRYFGKNVSIQFINDVDLPIKIVSGEVGWSRQNELQFVQIVPPRSRYRRETNFTFSTGGYIVLYLDGNMLGSDSENTRVIEFAASSQFFMYSKINMQDKTDEEFQRGLNAYNERSEDTVTLYFSENGKYYIAKAEIFVCWPNRTFRFIIQDFEPEAVGDGKH